MSPNHNTTPQEFPVTGHQPPYTPPPEQPPAPPGPPPQPHYQPRKPRPWWRTFLIVFAAVLAALAIVVVAVLALIGNTADQALHPNNVSHSSAPASHPASNPASPPVPSSSTVAVGQPLTVTQDGTDAATITITNVRASQQPADPSYGSAPQHGWFVTANVKVQALGSYSGGFDYNPLDFYAKSNGGHFEESNGNAYDAPGADREMDSGTLSAGESATGTLVFDLPAPHGTIKYAPNLDGTAIGGWHFNAVTAPAAPQSNAAAPAAAAPAQGDAAAVVTQFYADLNQHDYQGAWALGGSNLNGGAGDSAWVDGYATTAAIEVSASGTSNDGTLWANITATQTDGSVKTYHGTYTVSGGQIVSANIDQTS